MLRNTTIPLKNSFGATITANFELIDCSICFFNDLPLRSMSTRIPLLRSDDTIFIATRSEEDAMQLKQELEQLKG